MAKAIKTIVYDKNNDIFTISNGDNVKSSLDVGDFVIDINQDNLICGIEIMDASENLGINRDYLSSIQSIKMSITYKTNHAYILLMISFKKEEKEVNIPIPLTINLGHKIPKKETLVFN